MIINKKGISAVVANVLIVLLVVAGVVLLWTAVRPTIEQAGEQVSAECVTLDLEVTGCNVTIDDLTVRRNSGSGELSSARLIIGGDTTDCSTVSGIEQLGTATCDIGTAGNCTDGTMPCWSDDDCSAGNCSNPVATGIDLVDGDEVEIAAILGDGTVCNPLRGAYTC
ncbi:MAG: hypothetical protein QF460_02890 [Candidatus Nanoarchaeia archaeon]|nr:hypothetical protein [Candidatus Nanoarchaeia archaeon]